MSRVKPVIASIILLAGLGSSLVSAAAPGVNELVSKTNSGGAANGHAADGVLLSANGKNVIFASYATNIIPSTPSGAIYTRNLATSYVQQVDRSSAGVSGNSPSTYQAVSATGRYIVFKSSATNLIDGTTTPSSYAQLYLRDTVNSITTLISQRPNGTLFDDAQLNAGGISSDGRLVLLTTKASGLSPDVTDGTPAPLYA